MVSRSLRLVILRRALPALVCLMAMSHLYGDNSYAVAAGATGETFVSKDSRFQPAIQYGYGFHLEVTRLATDAPGTWGGSFSYRLLNDSLPVSGVIYRGFGGFSGGVFYGRRWPGGESASVEPFLRAGVVGHYSTYNLTELNFFHLSLETVPGITFVPFPNLQWLAIETKGIVAWEPRRGTPLGFSGSLSLSAVYRFDTVPSDE